MSIIKCGFWFKLKEFILIDCVYFFPDLFSMYYERISRCFAYARFGYKNHDFDSILLYDLMAFKLKRIYKCLKDGHAIQEKENMDALLEAIDICNRLSNENYESKYLDLHDSKWGELKHNCAKSGERYSRINFYREGVKTEEDKELEKQEFNKCYYLAEQDRQKDLDKLNWLFKQHLPCWWD